MENGMRPYRVFFLPDMWNDWHWFIYDLCNRLVASSDAGHFHLLDAQTEAEAVMRNRKAA
jgi:hypothetical protein